MKLEAKHTIVIGLALVAFGCIAYIWAEREMIRAKLQEAQTNTPQFQFGQYRRDDMIQEEHDASDDAGA